MSGRIEWLDLAKGMAIFLMVCGHTSIPGNVSNWIWSFHMPLFFLVSGMLFFPERYPSFGGFLKKRCRTLLLPWLVFSLVSVCYAPAESLTALSEGRNLGALWFLPVLFVTELLGYGIAKIQVGGGRITAAIFLASVGFAMEKMEIHVPYNIEVSLYATLFYVVGLISRERIVKMESRWWYVILLLVVNIVLSQVLPRTDMAGNKCGLYGLNAVNALVGTLMVFLFAKKMQTWSVRNWLRRFFLWAGANTIVVLGLSQVVNMSMKGMMESLPLPGAVSSLMRHVILWIALWIVATLINKYIPEVIGKKRTNH